MTKLEDRLAALATMSPAQLNKEWQRLLQLPCPRLGPELMRHAIGHHLQEQADRRLVGNATRALKAAAGKGTAALRPGTRLLRSWNGRNISVLVTEDGLEYEGRRWNSLSAIAREVTGAAWSGPRFFGLTGKGADG